MSSTIQSRGAHLKGETNSNAEKGAAEKGTAAKANVVKANVVKANVVKANVVKANAEKISVAKRREEVGNGSNGSGKNTAARDSAAGNTGVRTAGVGSPADSAGSRIGSTPVVVPGKWQIEAARPGDHHIACQLLSSVQRAPSPTEFQAQLEDPYFEPGDRLLCRVQNSLVGQARLVKREMRFGSTTLPVANLVDLLVLPENRHQGCGSSLLAACEREMAAEGALLGIVRTQQPHFFLRRGWCVWTRHSYSTAGAREILSQLLESRSHSEDEDADTSPDINIRWWRHIELTGMIRLYNENTHHSYGPLVRSDAYWHWLLSRHAFDRIYVAILGPDRFELDHGAAAMVGYAVMKEGRILEMMVSPDEPRAAEHLLARICSDTIEQDGNYVRLEAPVGDPLHHHIARAGGELSHHESQHGEVCLVKILDVPQTIERFSEHFHERARVAGLELPLELGLHVDGEKFALEVRPRSVKLRTGRHCRSYLTLGQSELTQLLLGHLELKVAVASGRVFPSTRIALETASVLFPKLPLWRPPWDELPAK